MSYPPTSVLSKKGDIDYDYSNNQKAYLFFHKWHHVQFVVTSAVSLVSQVIISLLQHVKIVPLARHTYVASFDSK